MRSHLGKADSPWVAWMLIYENKLKSTYNPSFLASIHLDLAALRKRFEEGADPVALVEADYVPTVSRATATATALQRRRALEMMKEMNAKRRTRKWVNASLAVGFAVASVFGYLSYFKWDAIHAEREALSQSAWAQAIGAK